MATIQQTPHAYTGPAILAGGYRIFFLGGALWAVLALLFWLVYITGIAGNLGANQDMLAWHAHELVYGYGGAVVAGFALTAIPNWTGRTPVRGTELGLLFALWFIARVLAVLLLYGWGADHPRAVAEIGFFILFVLLAAREIIGGGNWRNLKIVGVFLLLGAAALVANIQRLDGLVELSIVPWQTGLSVLLLLICIIGGRIIPAFTANWMRSQNMVNLPVMFAPFDGVAIGAAAVTLTAYLLGVDGLALVVTAGVTALLHFVRLYRWRGWKTLSSPIVFILHVSYFWVPTGFLLLALAASGILSEIAAIHAFAIGGVGSTTLAVMTRASLGHAGLPLANSTLLSSIYLSINLAAITRITAALWPQQYENFLSLSGLLWAVAFAMFLVKFTPLALRRP